jgi:antitoxin (DNA-binding transcriptional repressor) of toxin-antitoxin stability system
VIVKETSVNVREQKSRLSHYLRLAKAGESVEITDRRHTVGRIVPTILPVGRSNRGDGALGTVALEQPKNSNAGRPVRASKANGLSQTCWLKIAM